VAKRYLPRNLQLSMLMKLFEKLNPEVGLDLIDWESYVAEKTYSENLEDLAKAYPFYNWESPLTPPPTTYDEYALDALREEVEGLGGVIVPEYHYTRLKSVQERLEKLKKELKHVKNKSEQSEARLTAQIEESKKEIERLKTPLARPSYGDTVGSLEAYLKKVKKIRGVY